MQENSRFPRPVGPTAFAAAFKRLADQVDQRIAAPLQVDT